MSKMENINQEWRMERISEDLLDYNRQNYNYMQLELVDENFEKAPPISVAQYKARTAEVLPPGIFDDHDVHGIMVHSLEKIYFNDVEDPLKKVATDGPQKYKMQNDLKPVTKTLPKENKLGAMEQHLNDNNYVMQSQGIVKNNSQNKSENQKKKKKKFKQFDLNDSSSQNSKWTQPWRPDFSNKFRNDKDFPAL